MRDVFCALSLILRRRVLHATVCTASLAPLWSLGAQSSRTLADSAHWATITTDTGDLMPGHRDFSRYQTVELCDVAANNTLTVLWGTLRAQAAVTALQQTPARDTLLAGVAAVARACGARFTVESVAAHDLGQKDLVRSDLLLLLDLAFAEGNDALVHAAEARLFALAPTAAVRIAWLQQVIDQYLTAKPAHAAAAEAIVAQIDALGRSAQVARLEAHWRLLAFGQLSFDRGRIRQEAEQIISLAQAMSPGELMGDREKRVKTVIALWKSYEALLQIAVVDDPDSLPAIAQRAQQDFRRPAMQAMLNTVRDDPALKLNADASIDTESSETVLTRFAPAGQGVGRVLPRQQASFWFPANDSVQPRPGTITLLTGLPIGCIGFNNQKMCVELLTHVRQWLAKYGAAGLAVTVMVSTHGHSFYSGPQTPAEEGHGYAWYIRDYWKLSATVGVQEMPVSFNPAPDGTKIEDEQTFNTRFPDHDWLEGWIVEITGRAGQLLYRGGDWPRIDALLKRLFTHAVVTPVAVPSPAHLSPASPLSSSIPGVK